MGGNERGGDSAVVVLGDESASVVEGSEEGVGERRGGGIRSAGVELGVECIVTKGMRIGCCDERSEEYEGGMCLVTCLGA